MKRLGAHRLAALWLGLTVLGCEADPVPDAELDAGPGDVGADLGLDAGVFELGPRDAGPPPDVGVLFSAASCAPCGEGGACPAGGACLTAPGGESFCSDRCDTDLDGCIPGFSCLNLAADGQPEARFCVPPGATCRGGVGFGTPCYDGADACMAGLDHCEADRFSPGYCTRRCPDGACPTGYTCGPGDEGEAVCLAAQNTRAERCAVAPGRAACATDHECGWEDGERCVRSTPQLPGICAPPCGGGCGDGARCLATAVGDRCLPEDCACHGSTAAGGRDLLAEALASHGITRCDAILTRADLAPNPPDLLYDPYRLRFFEEAAHEPLRAPEVARTFIAQLDAAAASGPAPARAARTVDALASKLDHPARRQAPDPNPRGLVDALDTFVRLGAGTIDRAAVNRDAEDLPPGLADALAVVVDGMTRAVQARQASFPDGTAENIFRRGPAFVAQPRDGLGFDPASGPVRRLLNEFIDYGRLFGGAADLLDALAAADLPRFMAQPTGTATAPAQLLFSQPTPFGRIVVGGPGSDVYRPDLPGLGGDIALLVDLGGDDRYLVDAGGNRSAANPVSILVDLGGNDVYGYVEVPALGDEGRLPSDGEGRYRPRGDTDPLGPISFSDRARQGAGRAGIGILWDVGSGRDHYRSLRMSQGAGLFGVGVLLDGGGDDLYELETVGQGAGAFGIGILLDEGGDDVRRAYAAAQGYGYARGAGLAQDLTGDDQWLMNVGDPAFGGDPLYASAQRPRAANSSLGQGFGFGRRADFTDRAFFSGGIGVLLDASGDDRYEASIFAQGGGFWFGTGILADHAGNDSYDALWYAMGTGAHYALGLLLEGGGNDVYGGGLPRVNVTLAGAHDYTAAFLIDDGGNDLYFGSRISLGAGNVNGLGFFADNGGDDQYSLTRDYGLGSAGNLETDQPGSARRRVRSLGVFIDAGGRDSYDLDGMPFEGRGDDRAWVSNQNRDPAVAATELGTGIDGEGDSTLRARGSPIP